MFKKSLKMLLVLVMASFFVIACSSSKYDKITSSSGWKNFMNAYETVLVKTPVLDSYVNAVVTKKSIEDLIENGGLPSDKVAFIKSHKSDWRKILQVQLLLSMNEAGIDLNDGEYMYVAGVLNDSKAQVATNGPEYEIEKRFNTMSTGYKVAMMWRSRLAKNSNEMLDNMYKM